VIQKVDNEHKKRVAALLQSRDWILALSRFAPSPEHKALLFLVVKKLVVSNTRYRVPGTGYSTCTCTGTDDRPVQVR
jgi:hypothetical protein